jgi:hypothetical protein
MDPRFVFRIKAHALGQPRRILFPPAPQKHIGGAEAALGFPFPPLLKEIYLQVGNGGFGPGLGGSIIGVDGGYASDFGTLVTTYRTFQEGKEADGDAWTTGLLPFCEWGGLMFSSVDRTDANYRVHHSEALVAQPMNYSLQDFFQMWLDG